MSAGAPSACAAPQRLKEGGTPRDCCAIVVAGGAGERFGAPEGKQYVELCGLPVACWSLMALDRAPSVARIVVVVAPDRRDVMLDEVLKSISLGTPVSLAEAGETRQDSVWSGLSQVPAGLPLVAVHDAARPLIQPEVIEGCVARVRADRELAGAICATPSTDTLKLVEGEQVIATPDRSYYWAAQTPQVFWARRLRAAHAAARRDNYLGTDDASLVERCGGRVACFSSPRENIKVTVPEDYVIARALLERRLMREGCGMEDRQGEGL